MAVEAVAAVRWDGSGVGVELSLGSAESGIGGRGGGGRDRRECDGWEGSGDNAGGEGNGSHYQLLLMN